MPSKKGKASSGNIGLRIDGDLLLEKLKVVEKIFEKFPQSYNKFGKSFYGKLVQATKVL